MKPIYLSLLLLSCSSSQQVTTPPVVKNDTVFVQRVVHDTTRIIQQVDRPVPLNLDSSVTTITLHPSGGDDWSQIQAAVDLHKHVRLTAGVFRISRPIMVINLQDGSYGQSWCDIQGPTPAEDTYGAFTAQILPSFSDRPALMIQLGKGCIVRNLVIAGQYRAPATQYQVNTFTRSQWRTGTRDVATSPYAGIVIDPFSDPAALGNDSTKGYPGLWSYYIPGMNRSGSTAIQITGCNIQGFNVGILITAVNQQNGESITIDHDQIGNCLSAIASTQAQAKKNVVRDCMFWGPTHTIIDGVHYGLPHTDGATIPDVEDCNVAGMNYQLVESYSNFLTRFSGVYTENLFKIGWTGLQSSANTPVIFDACQFDMEPGSPVPDCWYRGANTKFRDCVVRYYNGGEPEQQIVLNDAGDSIDGGMWGAPPIRLSGQQIATATVTLHITADSAYYLATNTVGLTRGQLILTALPESIDSLSYYHPRTQPMNWQTPVGYIKSVSGDTVRLVNVGLQFKDGQTIDIY